MIGGPAGERRIVHCEIGDQARRPAQNPVERENWPPRWEAEDRRRHSESRFESAQRGPPPSSPFVEIAEQDGRHWRQAVKRRHQGVDLVDARKPEEAKMRRDDAKLAVAEVDLGDDGASRLAPRQLEP